MPMTPREMIRTLEANGFLFKSANGSHKKFEKKGVIVVVPVHSGTLKWHRTGDFEAGWA